MCVYIYVCSYLHRIFIHIQMQYVYPEEQKIISPLKVAVFALL